MATKKHTPAKQANKAMNATSGRNANSPRQAVKSKASQTAWGFLGALAEVVRNSRIAMVVVVLLALLVFGIVFDSVANSGKAYAGVSVEGLDVGGLNAEQIRTEVEQEFAKRISAAGVTIYANQNAILDRNTATEEIDEDLLSVEEATRSRTSWSTDSAQLQAYIDYDTLVENVLAVGRGGILDRLQLLFNSQDVAIPLNFNEAIVEALASSIDESIGQPLENYGVAIDSGYVSVSVGHDGNMVDRNTLKEQLSAKLLSPDADNRHFIAELVYTPVQINEASAKQTVETIDAAIQQGIQFTCGNKQWLATASDLGAWVQTVEAQREDGTCYLAPSFSLQKARAGILSHIAPSYENGEGHIRFAKANDEIIVGVTSPGSFPLVGDAIEQLNLALFSHGTSSAQNISVPAEGPIQVNLETAEIPQSMTFEEALSFGVITAISEYTTEYTTGATERNHNIHLVADLLNNSIVPTNEGTWSFNNIAGECNEEKGFQEAKAVAGDQLIDEIGGGICQVATTVFNAVYEAGYPITERYNHSVYFASYPQGRDAAISWPAPDLKWQNDSPSDILLKLSYTDSSVTATLYGEDMGYVVESEEGEWLEGQEYTTVYETDETLAPGYEYVRTYGENGHSITVTRTVYDSEGSTLRTDSFASVYQPQNTVIVRGAGATSWNETYYSGEAIANENFDYSAQQDYGTYENGGI